MSVACQVDTLPPGHDIHNPITLPVTTSQSLQAKVTSFSETNSVDCSVISEDGDIITIVTADRVTASVLHADTDASSISIDQEENVVTPLCSPSRENDNSKQTTDMDIVTVENTIGGDSDGTPQTRTGSNNKKSVRFQDASNDVKPLQSNSIVVALDKVCCLFTSVFVCTYVHNMVNSEFKYSSIIFV